MVAVNTRPSNRSRTGQDLLQGQVQYPAAGHGLKGTSVDQRPPDDGEESPVRRVKSQPISMITRRRRQYLWDQRLPLGEVTLWVGHAGIGKSQAAVWLAAQVSQGALPGELYGQPSPVLYLGTEDSWEYTLAPRFDAAHGDPERIHRLYVEAEDGEEAVLALAVDIDALRDEIAASGARLVVLDALLSTFGSAKLTEQGVVRRHLEPLARLAQELNIAIVGVAHFRKASDPNPLHMISGSAEFGQVVRSAIGFAADQEAEDGSGVLSLVKTNIAPASLPSLRYRIEPAVVTTLEGPTDVGRFVPLGDTEQTVGELLNYAPESSEERSEKSEAAEWLISYLTSGNRGGEAEAGDVLKAGDRVGFQKRTLQRARVKAGVTTRKKGESWVWSYNPSDHSGR